MTAEQTRKNNEFLARFQRAPRFVMPDYIAHQKNEGKPLGHEPTKPKKGSGKTVSVRAQIAKTIRFSKDLKMVSTDRQLRAFGLLQADRIISQQRRKAKAKAVSA